MIFSRLLLLANLERFDRYNFHALKIPKILPQNYLIPLYCTSPLATCATAELWLSCSTYLCRLCNKPLQAELLELLLECDVPRELSSHSHWVSASQGCLNIEHIPFSLM